MKIDVNRVKIIVSVPIDSIDEVRNVLYDSGAGNIGNYTCCSMTSKCVGSFKRLNNSNPYIGEKGKVNFVEEERIEIVCDVDKVKNVIKRLRQIHPYEEPEIDIIPLIDEELF